MRLRIFEPRYKRLISQAMRGDGTFGICLYESSGAAGQADTSKVGTLVKITDFDRLEDGLLGITVTGLERFVIHNIRNEYDGLRVARVEWLANWNVSELDDFGVALSLQLQKVYEQFPTVGELYQQRFYDDASWVVQRWLELLPIDKAKFDHLASQLDCSDALNYLKQRLEISHHID